MTEKPNKATIGDFTRKSEGISAVKSFLSGDDTGSLEKAPVSKEAQENSSGDKKQTMTEVNEEITKLERDIESVEKAPELTYVGRLDAIGLSREDAEEIIDAMLVKGEFRKTYQITKKHSVTFRSRILEDQNRALDVIEVKNPQYPSTVGNIVSECNLAASIVQFRDIEFADDMPIAKRLEWTRKLPDTVATILASKLSKFDNMLMTVLDEGAIENF